MRIRLLARICFLAIAVQALVSSASAFEKETRIPLVGYNKYLAASGSARLYEIRRVAKQKDREEVVVEVKNVPLTPGTVLVVNIDNEQVGNLTLNAKRSGTFKLTSDARKFIPKIDAGTSVTVTTVDGHLVMR